MRAADGPVTLVAHSAGALATVHWAVSGSTDLVASALLVTPPALIEELPPKYPPLEALRAEGWLPIPMRELPFRAQVGISDDDPLGPVDAVRDLARAWGATERRLGRVGHANPDSGYGSWPAIEQVIEGAPVRG